MKTPHNFIDLTGRNYGRLTVLRRVAPEEWACRCSCGKEHKVRGGHLRQSRIRSCGCLARALKTTHGLHKTKVYTAAVYAKTRCSPSYRDAQDYFGRGIRFFPQFDGRVGLAAQWISDNLGWPVPWLELSLDRIDNNGNYEPGNLRWASPLEQLRNTRLHSLDRFTDEEIRTEYERRFTS